MILVLAEANRLSNLSGLKHVMGKVGLKVEAKLAATVKNTFLILSFRRCFRYRYSVFCYEKSTCNQLAEQVNKIEVK